MPPRNFVFVVVNGEASVEGAEPDQDPAYQIERPVRKRPHHKSRRGCLACKRRRVKCDEQFPCSNCSKRHERCIQSRKSGGSSVESSTSLPSPRSDLASVGINLLHLELFSHFQSGLVDSLAFPEIWQQVLPWAFQETYIMCPILCLAATHLSTLQPQVPRYADAAAQLLTKSVSLFNERLSSPMTARNSEALVSVSIIMHYIAWSSTHFIAQKQGNSPRGKDGTFLAAHLSNDPLLQLSFGVKGILCEVLRILAGSNSVFLAAGHYSPVHAIEEAILREGQDPLKFVGHFGSILNHLLLSDDSGSNTETALTSPQKPSSTQGPAFEGIVKRLSLLFCLISISTSTSPSASRTLAHLQFDIERCFFSFPIHYSGTFRSLALQGDSGALIILCHFYRAARILLTSPRTWWARERSRAIESLILDDLASRGLEVHVLSERL